ncbi:MAG TPA: AtzE family amidohydrolase [Sphingomonadaceae bacterium]|nr:AtzE family amidohydrolase [Sphingomonadaceae bacterium]
MIAPVSDLGVAEIASQVRSGTLSAAVILEQVLARIERLDAALNCFTGLFLDRARAAALRVDAMVAQGRDPGALAGVPFGAKNLFDVAGEITLAGSKILRESAPAAKDAALIRKAEQQGAILVGALNMDEFAYGFSTENEHYGATRNPHDPARIAGGSSGGSAAAVAARMLPLTLGSDTNGSVRVPAALCGIFGMKPTYGRLDRTGMYPFVDSLDHGGFFARTVADLALAYDVMQEGPSVAGLLDDSTGLRVARLGGWFAQPAGQGVMKAVERVSAALGGLPEVELVASDVARSAAFCITVSEGGSLHLGNLRQRPQDFDLATRDRLMAGALIPSAIVLQAQRFRSWYRDQAARIFEHYDVLVAPATICSAPFIGQEAVEIAGHMLPVRANLGLFTQPISFIGLPVICVPVADCPDMPLGVQIIAAPGREDHLLRIAARLEREGIAISRPFAERDRMPMDAVH